MAHITTVWWMLNVLFVRFTVALSCSTSAEVACWTGMMWFNYPWEPFAIGFCWMIAFFCYIILSHAVYNVLCAVIPLPVKSSLGICVDD